MTHFINLHFLLWLKRRLLTFCLNGQVIRKASLPSRIPRPCSPWTKLAFQRIIRKLKSFFLVAFLILTSLHFRAIPFLQLRKRKRREAWCRSRSPWYFGQHYDRGNHRFLDSRWISFPTWWSYRKVLTSPQFFDKAMTVINSFICASTSASKRAMSWYWRWRTQIRSTDFTQRSGNAWKVCGRIGQWFDKSFA